MHIKELGLLIAASNSPLNKILHIDIYRVTIPVGKNLALLVGDLMAVAMGATHRCSVLYLYFSPFFFHIVLRLILTCVPDLASYAKAIDESIIPRRSIA